MVKVTGYTGHYTITIDEAQRELLVEALSRLPPLVLNNSQQIAERAVLLANFRELQGAPREVTHGFCL